MRDKATNRNVQGFDPRLTDRLVNAVRPLSKGWFRWEVRDLDSFPQVGGALIVSNHSGGMLTPDVLIYASAFYEKFGYDRPLYTLGHDALFVGPLGVVMRRIGLVRANRDSAISALRAGGVVLVFPGGVYDSYRPTVAENVIDFNGRTGYVRLALDADVPIVPAVSIGGQESQLFLTRGSWLAKRLGLQRFRSDVLPITVGFPFGVSAVLPVNIPLPTKMVYRCLKPVDVRYGNGDSDIDRIDACVRSRMQSALDELAHERRFPVLG
jgi:1-acyl-sn-glycerol-3-phosphate acyltransferase